MTEHIDLSFPAEETIQRQAHVGVVASGDLEVLLEPLDGESAEVRVHTNVTGHRMTWEALLERFFSRYPYALRLEIRDHGATPGMVWLRLEQAVELAGKEAHS
ncbi:malonate decarboxylase acyl carrier protein [Granulicella arctica]|uniref:Malonate decarboxylase acyl carrier protein n=1 Tax=Granulicella arctica TaxID=940613 RepID=A0A7Y9PGY7_9BACT|nr:malonate decarboxylase acyl carrier protein [Granulicella arctica]NYF79559.1 malonate decarboxylase delta subunit [Granulicella arctica]